jgi:hypothetical protein
LFSFLQQLQQRSLKKERDQKRYSEISYPLFVCSVDALFMAARLQRREFHHHYPAIKARLMCYSYLGRILLRCHYFISSQLSVFTWRTRPRVDVCERGHKFICDSAHLQRGREKRKQCMQGVKRKRGFSGRKITTLLFGLGYIHVKVFAGNKFFSENKCTRIRIYMARFN